MSKVIKLNPGLTDKQKKYIEWAKNRCISDIVETFESFKEGKKTDIWAGGLCNYVRNNLERYWIFEDLENHNNIPDWAAKAVERENSAYVAVAESKRERLKALSGKQDEK